MKENGSKVLKFKWHSETDPKIQGSNVKLVLIKMDGYRLTVSKNKNFLKIFFRIFNLCGASSI